jgi:uncharacterized membrane protein YcaP (DUF421 family)
MDPIFGILFRVMFMYVFALTVVRLCGKRGIGNMSMQDFVVMVILGDMFDDVFWSEIAVIKAVVGISTIASLHILLSIGTSKSKAFDTLLGSNPVPMIRNGVVDKKGLQSQRMRMPDVAWLLREHEIEDAAEVREARMEPLGDLSAVLKEEFKPADRRDTEALKASLR